MRFIVIFSILLINCSILYSDGFIIEDEINQYELENFLESIGKNNKKDSIKLDRFIRKSIFQDSTLLNKFNNKDFLNEYLNNSEIFRNISNDDIVITHRLKTDLSFDSLVNIRNVTKLKYSNERFKFVTSLISNEKYKINPDYYSFFGRYFDGDFEILIGDFQILSGLGLIFANQFRSNNFIITNDYNPFEIEGYSSTYYGNNFFGVATNKKLEFKSIKFEFGGFISSRKKSGRFFNDTIINIKYGDYSSEKNILENSLGINLNLKNNLINVSYNFFGISYDKPIKSYNKSLIEGKTGILNSLTLEKSFSNYSFLSEIAFDNEFDPSFIIRFNNRAENLSYSVIMRYISEFYNSPFGVNSGSKSTLNNELGITFSAILKNKESGETSANIDFFKEIVTVSDKYLGWNFILINEQDFMEKIKSRFIFRIYDSYISNSYLIDEPSALNNIYKLRWDLKYLLNKFTMGIIFDYKKQYNNQLENDDGYGAKIYLTFKSIENLYLNISANLYSTGNYATAIWYLERIHTGYFINQSNYLEGSNFSINLDYKLNYLTTSIKLINKNQIIEKKFKRENIFFGEINLNL